MLTHSGSAAYGGCEIGPFFKGLSYLLPRYATPVHGLSNSLFSFLFNHIHYSENLQLDTLMLLLNREGSFRTEGSPMESCRPAIIVSFGVTAHWRPKGCQ